MPVRAKHFEYSISLDRDGEVAAEGCPPIDLGDEWHAEHLVLAGLARCSISSFVYFARQGNVDASAEATAIGRVTRRQDDRYGFVEIECHVDAQLDPEPAADDLRRILQSAEWGCFVGASLRPAPKYQWRVNGRAVA